MNDNYKFMVCTRCMTYNHGDYIEDAMNGFSMQQTTFPVVTVIVDDASTDDTQKVIKAYLLKHFVRTDPCCYEKDSDKAHTIFVRHLTNKNCYFAIVFLKENMYGKESKRLYYEEWTNNAKYLALCEGDDYWTYPLKLQKQVDYLENHTDYSFTCHRYKVYDQENNDWLSDGFDDLFYQNNKGYIIGDITKKPESKWITQTLSMVYRSEGLEDFIIFRNTWDFIRIYFLKKNGKGFCFNENFN